MENQEKVNYIYGMHPVLEAINAGKNIDKVYLKSGLEGESFRQLLSLMQSKGIAFQFVPVQRLDRITKARHQGVIAQLPSIEYSSMEQAVEYASSNGGLILVLDGVSDVRNFGAIARSAECAGFKSIILPAKGGASITPDSIKTSAGALLRLNVCKVPNIRTALYYLKERDYTIVSASEKGSKLIYDVDFSKPVAIVMGDEHNGVSDSALKLSDVIAAIPMAGGIGSLNVSVASAIVMYEVVRQRRNA